MKKYIVCMLALVLLAAAAGACAQKVAIKMYENVGAYSKPTPYSTFVGWAKMEQQYEVLSSEKGHLGRTWLKVALDDGTQGYIPQTMTTDVIEDVAAATKSYVKVYPEGNLHMHRKALRYHDDGELKPYCDSPLMGWAKKGEVYPVIDGPKNGWVKIAFENGTAGWVSAEGARPYDPVEDAKPKKIRVTHATSVLVRRKPDRTSEQMTGIRPGEEYPCVYVCDNGWYEIELPSGAYGYVCGNLVELIVEE